MLEGLPGRRAFFNSSSSTSYWCTNLGINCEPMIHDNNAQEREACSLHFDQFLGQVQVDSLAIVGPGCFLKVCRPVDCSLRTLMMLLMVDIVQKRR